MILNGQVMCQTDLYFSYHFKTSNFETLHYTYYHPLDIAIYMCSDLCSMALGFFGQLQCFIISYYRLLVVRLVEE